MSAIGFMRRLACVGLLASALVASIGCSGSVDAPAPQPAVVYRIADRQLPPEPVYARTAWAALPEPIPGELGARGPRMAQKASVNLAQVTLETASRRLGKIFGYRTYCAASIADQRVTIKQRGDLDDLAEALASQAAIRVVVDHENRELRLFALN